MNTFLLERLSSHINVIDPINIDYKTASLPTSLAVEDIEFANSRGSVRLCNINVLTPAEEEKMLNEILEFDFGK